jgi:transposase-like protein
MPIQQATKKPEQAAGNERSGKFKCRICGETFNTELEYAKHHADAHEKMTNEKWPGPDEGPASQN